MATKGKLKKKFRTRLTPTEKQKSYIERVSNPTSPADLLLALQDPSTPAYKEMMNQITAGKEMQAIISILIQRFLIETYIASQREKEEIFKNMIAQEHAQQKDPRAPYDLKGTLPAKSSFAEEEEKLKEKIENRAVIIQDLKKSIDTLKVEIKQLDAKAAQNTEAWQQTAQRQRDHFLQDLEANGIPIRSSSGKIIDKNDPRYAALTTPQKTDPMKIISVVSASHELHETKPIANHAEAITNQTEGKAIPPAPPKPPPDFSKQSKRMAQKTCLMEQIKFLANLRDDNDSASDMLKALANNKELGGRFPGAQKKAKETGKAHDELEKVDAQTTDPDLKERTDLFAKAQDIHAEKKAKQDVLLTKVMEVNKQEMLQAVDQKSLEGLLKQEEKGMTAKAPAVIKHH